MSLETALIELHYLPSVQYFAHLIRYPDLMIEGAENYQKGSYRNKCAIATANGILRLSVPLEGGKHQQQPIREVRIAYTDPWRQKHWRSIESAYGNSPFFIHYRDEFQAVFAKKHAFLFELNLELLQTLIRLMKLDIGISFTQSYLATVTVPGIADLRNRISLKGPPDPDFSPATYSQVFQERFGFIHKLSILDLLFCCGPGARGILEKSMLSAPPGSPGKNTEHDEPITE